MPEPDTAYSDAMRNISRNKWAITVLGIAAMFLMVYAYKAPLKYVGLVGGAVVLLLVISGGYESPRPRTIREAEEEILKHINRVYEQLIPEMGVYDIGFKNYRFNGKARLHTDETNKPWMWSIGLIDVNKETNQPRCFVVDVLARRSEGDIAGVEFLGVGDQYEYRGEQRYIFDTKEGKMDKVGKDD